MNTALSSALEGRYAIDREIGRGGMATVYLARDVRHNRNVALKLLNAELGAVLGVERFLAEIEVTANLQHPHLLPLFDSGEAAGLLFYVMPVVEGESLRARLEREKQLPVEEAVRIAIAVASALDYAHRHGVVHRDLKPENILLHDGEPVVADFGIALAVSNAGGERITQTGLSLGTPQYMSPEQATGDRTVDGRSDIYSLAALTYEMLAGEAPHLGNTVQAIVAKVLTERPVNVRVRRPTVPEHVAAALDKALEKTPADRFSTAHEFSDALQGKSGTTVPARVSRGARIPGVRSLARMREVAAWILVALGAGWLGWQYVHPRVMDEAPVVRANFDLPPNVRVQDALTGSTIAVSPRGDLIAFTAIGTAGFRMYVRHTNELAAREITDANVAGRNLAFSPDGRWLAFTEGNVVKKVAVDGGQAVTVLASLPTAGYGLTWLSPETILVGSFSGLLTLPSSGGTVRTVTHADSAALLLGQRWPVALEERDAVIYATGNQSGGDSRLAAMALSTGRITVFDLPASAPIGVLDGQLVYVTATGTLMAVQFDERRLRPIGEPIPLEEGVVADVTAGVKATLSASGTLAYLRGRPEFQPVLVRGAFSVRSSLGSKWGDAGGGTAVPVIRELHQYSTPRFSPDGGRIAISVRSATSTDIWVYDIKRNTFTRITTEGSNVRPEWSPDGKRVLFRSERQGKVGIWWQPADGSSPAELLYEPDVEPYEALMSPDGKWLVYRTAPGATWSRDIFAVPLQGERTPIPLVTGPSTESMPRLSPDGNWLAYQSNEGGRSEIYVRPFPGAGARVQVSDDGGTEPIWSRFGLALYYRRSSGDVSAVSVTTGNTFSIGERRVVLTGDYLTDASHASYDVAPDGRFLMLKRAGAEAQTVVVHNWGRELREKTAARR